MPRIDVRCRSCDGTGIYVGFAEPKGIGVICLTCDGTGCEQISYWPFTKRRKRKDVQRVYQSLGSFIATGIGPRGSEISYADFLKGKRP